MKAGKAAINLLAITFFYFIFWSIGMTIGTIIFPSEAMTPDAAGSTILFRMLLASFLNAIIVMYAIYQSHARGWKLFTVIALQIFAIQFFLAQIETLWFNNALQLPLNLIYAVIFGGLLTALATSFISILLMGTFKKAEIPLVNNAKIDKKKLFVRITLLAVVIYPMLYILAGHFIAWQYEPLRIHYTGSAESRAFLESFTGFITSSLWPWQIFRGFLWIAVAWPMLKILRCQFPHNGIIIGLLFAVLMNAQHLLPNPYMPGLIPVVHAIETSLSNFIWGFLIAWLLSPHIVNSRAENDS